MHITQLSRFIIILFAIACASFKWPIENGKITSSFGESRGDLFHDGIFMISKDDKVKPIKKGKLFYLWDKSLFPLENHPGGGNYKILKHDKDYYSVYMHLKDGVGTKKEYNENDIIGIIGNTGHSYGKHLHFTIIELKKKCSINPFTLLPKVKDRKAPKIFDIYMKIGEQYQMLRNNSNVRLTKNRPLLIKVLDSINKNERLGIYKLKVWMNGSQVFNTTYKNINYSKNGLKIENKIFTDIFDEKSYYRIADLKYVDGKNNLKIVALDYSGNHSEKTYNLNIQLDIEN